MCALYAELRRQCAQDKALEHLLSAPRPAATAGGVAALLNATLFLDHDDRHHSERMRSCVVKCRAELGRDVGLQELALAMWEASAALRTGQRAGANDSARGRLVESLSELGADIVLSEKVMRAASECE